MMRDGIIIDSGTPDQLLKKHGRENFRRSFFTACKE